MRASGDNEAGILQFQELRKSSDRNRCLVLYEASVNARVFAYLYLRSATCSLVWRSNRSFKFDCTLPFEFLDTQFTDLPPSKIEFIERAVPRFGSSMLHKPYRLKKCLVVLFLADGGGLREYDLVDPVSQDKYLSEIVEDKDSLANVAFGRYDLELSYRRRLISYSLTIEKLDNSSTEGWEFAINVPRDLELKDATLKWIAKHHSIREMRGMNFEDSRTRLSKMIKPQTEPIYA
jgi:hypothetical protein